MLKQIQAEFGGSFPSSLPDLLSDSDRRFSLNARLEVAKKLPVGGLIEVYLGHHHRSPFVGLGERLPSRSQTAVFIQLALWSV